MAKAQSLLFRLLPITDWLFVNYNWKQDLAFDVVGGLTIAVMQVPQGMAYSLLANVPPILGIYTAIFPVFIYAIFGSSKHISVGTNALMGMLCATVVAKYATDGDSAEGYTETEVISMVCLMSGLWQVALSMTGIGHLSWLLSEVLMSSYTACGCFHAFVSQIKVFLGLTVPRRAGPLKLIYSFMDLAKEIKNTNFAPLVIGTVSLVILLVNNDYIKPKLSKHCRFPVPIQLLVIMLGTAFSVLFDFHKGFGVAVVGHVPVGLPVPSVPNVSLFKDIILETLVIASVGYSVLLAMAKLTASMGNYAVNGNKELFGEGMGSIFGSFFHCLPCGVAMSRCLVQFGVGGKTQLVSIVSACTLIIIILFIGPLFEQLPKACLSAIIIAAIKNLLLQVLDVPDYFRKSFLDGLLWVLTALAVLVLDVDSGLGIGLLLNVCLAWYRGIRIKVQEEAVSPEGVLAVKVTGFLTFGSYEKMLLKLNSCLKKSNRKLLKAVLLDLTELKQLDPTACRNIIEWTLKDDKRQLVVTEKGQASEMLILFSTGKGRWHNTREEAITQVVESSRQKEGSV